MRSRSWIRNADINSAVNKLRKRDGFRTVFEKNWWAVYRDRVNRNGIKYWEAVFRYRITGGTSEVDSVAPPNNALVLTDEPLLLPDEPSQLLDKPLQSTGETLQVDAPSNGATV